MPERSEKFPEIPSGVESSIIRDAVEASYHEIVPNDHEWEMLRQPLLGEEGYGADLFSRFEDQATDYGYGVKTVAIKVFPTEQKLPDDASLRDEAKETPLQKRVALQSHEGNAIIFNDELAGVEINLMRHERRGILTFILTDHTGEGNGTNGELARQADTFTTSSITLKFKDPAERIMEAYATMYSEGQTTNIAFVPTSASQLVILNIVQELLRSPHS